MKIVEKLKLVVFKKLVNRIHRVNLNSSSLYNYKFGFKLELSLKFIGIYFSPFIDLDIKHWSKYFSDNNLSKGSF